MFLWQFVRCSHDHLGFTRKEISWHKGWFYVWFRHTLHRVCSEKAAIETKTEKLKLNMNQMKENWMKKSWIKKNGM